MEWVYQRWEFLGKYNCIELTEKDRILNEFTKHSVDSRYGTICRQNEEE